MAEDGFDKNGYDADGNWLECLPWDGQEKSLPLGYTTMVPGLGVSKFIKRVEVLDAEEDAGYREIKPSELKPDDIIVGAVINENSTKKVADTYGGDWIRLKEANSGKSLNRLQWQEKFGTDGLELLAIKELRGKQAGTLPPTQNISAAAMKPVPPSQPVYKIG
jgi:hypothetical protein